MTLDQLRVFVAVAEREHMTRAAEALNLTQSGVSSAVSTLEAQFSTLLFDRVGRRVALTEAGRLLLTEAKAILSRVELAEIAVAELEGLQRGILRIHASQTIASYWLPRQIVAFRRLYPGIRVSVTIGNTSMVERAFTRGEADVGFVEGDTAEPGIRKQIIAKDRLCLVVGRQHPWAGRKVAKPADLIKLDWVLREVGSGTRSVLENAIKSFGVPIHQMRVSIELPSNEAVRTAVEEGLGVTALSYLVVESGLRSGALRKLPISLPDRHFIALRHMTRREPKAVHALLQLIAPSDPRARKT